VRLAIAMLLAGLVAGCAHAPRKGEDLAESLRTYHEGVRWQRFPAAASRIPAAQRDEFVEERDRLADDLQISDYEVVRVSARGEKRAEVQVKYTWYLDSEGVVRKTHAVEEWERHGKVWLLVDEHRLRGDPMPGLADDDASAPDDAAGPPSEPAAAAEDGQGAAASASSASGS
jgi:hypothetical protein